MKRLFSFLFCNVCLTLLYAYDIQVDGLYYNLISGTTPQAVVTYEYYDSPNNYTTLDKVVVPDSIIWEGTTYYVTTIGKYAFANSPISDISMSNRINDIQENAFSGSIGLTSINIPNSVTTITKGAFQGCTGLTSITISEGVTTLKDYAFQGCTNLRTITIPNSIKNIRSYAFQGCSELTTITISKKISSVGHDIFKDCPKITTIICNSKNATISNSRIFEDILQQITTVIFNTDTIANYACKDMPNLANVSIGDSVVYIGANAFRNCIGLTDITIPNGVQTIESMAFYGCTGLTSITIPNSVQTIGSKAFSECTGLKKTNYIGSVADWYKIEAYSTPIYYSHNFYINDVLLTHLDIPKGMDTITDALSCDTCLISVTIPTSVTSIGSYAFRGCTGLTDIAIPNSVTTIGDVAFYGCTGLSSFTIPSNITSVGSWAFSGCTGLTDFTIEVLTHVEDLYYNTLADDLDPSVVIHIPCGTNSEYAGDYYKGKTFTFVEPEAPYTIHTNSTDTTKGSAIVMQPNTCNSDTAIIFAQSNLGYHFVEWNDKNTDNPRIVVLTQDSTFSAKFSIDLYTISSYANEGKRGVTKGDTIAEYNSVITLTATPNYGYHFSHWADQYNNTLSTDNPYTFTATSSSTYIAVFEKNIYSISTNVSPTEFGYIDAPYQAEYLNAITLIAYPIHGYHFAQWNDGNTDNPRTIVLTQDTILIAEFDQNYSGQCGDNLYWRYDNNILTISGNGDMYDYEEYDMPWSLLRDATSKIIMERGITRIGNNAFRGFVGISKIELPNTLLSIGENAFADCRTLYDVYSYAIEPPFAEPSSFSNYNVYVHIPCDNLRAYQLDAVFGTFKYVRCINADNAEADDLTITPSNTEAEFVWPSDESADTYTLDIYKDGEVFCTLVFNANGQLNSIAFAPSRIGKAHQAAEKTGNGFRFTVTGLTQDTHYQFNMDVEDKQNTTLQTYTGEFSTTSTALHETSINEEVKKIVCNGQVYIQKNNKIYTVIGTETK